jgi:LPS-assembly lipoprotein
MKKSFFHWIPALVCQAMAGTTALAALAGCGFQLQGRAPLPSTLAVAFVQAEDQQSDFVQGLRKALIASGAELAKSREGASGTVRIVKDEVERNVLSVSARNTPREYEVTYTVRFSVSAGDEELLPEQEVALSRDYSFDERALLAKEHEEAILREALAQDLVGIVMRRLASL